MRKFFLILATVAISTALQAQYGATIKYQSVNSAYWEDLFQEADGEYANQFIGVSAFYWFRLKEKRIEFLPELGYHTSIGNSSTTLTSDIQRISFLFNVDVYLFDIINDCDCPTFSKQGTGIQRSLFFELSPGLDYQLLSIHDDSGQNRTYDKSEPTFRIGLGVGFDIGISDMFTVTPIVSINYATRPKWDGLADVLDPPTVSDDKNSEWIIAVGVRLTFRPDYKRRFR